MEGMREVALAHYKILPDEEKSSIQRDFEQMVADGSDSEYFKSIFDEIKPENIDQLLETCKKYKGSGNLDFKDFITLKYILKNQIVLMCDGCSSLMVGTSFFSCYECFCNAAEDSYDLCCGCYSSNKFKDHKHQRLYDNYTLLKESRAMFAQMKTGRDKRETLEKVYISFASAFLDLAGEVKSKDDDSRDYEFNPKEKLGEISRRAKELEEMSDAATAKEEDKNFEEYLFSKWIPTRRGGVDLLGVVPSFEPFVESHTIQ